MPDLAVFVSLGGQEDNLGDSVLRRRLLDALRIENAVPHVFVGAHSAGYTAGLGIEPGDVLYTDYRAWRIAAIRSALRGPTTYVHNAGEIQVNRARRRNSVFEFALGALLRLRGRRPILTGVGIRHTDAGLPGIIRAVVRQAEPVVWRDAVSREAAGIGESGPDWAFGIAAMSSPSGPRDRVAVSVRSDRPEISEEALRALAATLAEEGLTPLVVTQVVRDTAHNQRIADILGCEHVGWADAASHPEQERIVRDLFATCRAVVSDRLHALIIGLTEGAVPVPVATTADRKLGRTLASGGVSVPVTELTASGAADALAKAVLAALAQRDEQVSNAARAYDEVLRVEERVRAALGAPALVTR